MKELTFNNVRDFDNFKQATAVKPYTRQKPIHYDWKVKGGKIIVKVSAQDVAELGY